MNRLIKEFKTKLGSLKIYEDKIECVSKLTIFSFGSSVHTINVDNIRNFEILDLDAIGIKGPNPFNIRIIRIHSLGKSEIYTTGKTDWNKKGYLDIDIGINEKLADEIINFDPFKRIEKERIEELKKLQNELEKEEQNRLLQLEKEEQNRLKKLNKNRSSVLQELDKNNDNQVDLVENSFNKLISKNQKIVSEIDKNYIHKFVKTSSYIKTKQQNIQRIYESIRDTSSQEELDDRVSLLKNQIHSYELLVFHSINMIGALIAEDLITFYEIYESFDKLGMFNSNWENEVSEKLTNIGDKLDDLMESIYNMEQNIVNELSHLSYVTQESFEDLNRSVTSQLKEVESSINTNNLLTGIQAYQLYKINKNTKGIR